jgi:signal transduction histidine kinase
LRAGNDVLAAILDAAGDGALLVDRQGSILAASSGAEALFRCRSQQLAGRVFTELLAPEHSALACALLREVLDGTSGGKRSCEVLGCSRDPPPPSLAMSIAPIAGCKDRLCIVFRDTAPWKANERDLVEARRRAEAASSAKSEFLAKISHEVRTPLNSILGFSEVMLTEQFGVIGNERYREYLRDIHACGTHLLSLINDLLDLSKIEAGKLHLSFTAVALNDLIVQCVASMQPQARGSRIIIRTAFAPALPPVLADARSVRQIVLNLLSNSLKFTPSGGQVIVSTALTSEGHVALRVRDTGVGMSENDIAAAMEPFRQLSTSPRGGTGLGLPLTKVMAEANRARFRLTSAVNEGTLVEILFQQAARNRPDESHA